MAFAKNVRTGKTVVVPEHYIGHPVLGKDLVAVGDEVQAAPKKEKKKKSAGFNPEATDGDRDGFVQDATVWERPVDTITEEQPAPDYDTEIEDTEDAN
jgi:hypothetical protein